ncbi:MAG: transglutaminase domain-containing protein [Pseudomonadales bacterium]
MLQFNYSVDIEPVGSSDEPIHIFIPLALNSPQQQVLAEKITASIPGNIEQEDRYGNRFWHGYLPKTNDEAITFSMEVTVQRKPAKLRIPDSSGELTAADQLALAKYLSANERVLVNDPILDPILAELRARLQGDNPVANMRSAMARNIYDWVVDNVEYKKVGSGWGNGDTYWACTERYGNCTDFHALFISLARSEGIPARFEIGFPVPEDRVAGNIGGYHCWVQFYLPEKGWFPVDASEAFKNPARREYFFGAHPADRIHFTTGRDLRLGDAHKSAPLNYFIYPHVEVGGKPYNKDVSKQFSFKNLDAGKLAQNKQ